MEQLSLGHPYTAGCIFKFWTDLLKENRELTPEFVNHHYADTLNFLKKEIIESYFLKNIQGDVDYLPINFYECLSVFRIVELVDVFFVLDSFLVTDR